MFRSNPAQKNTNSRQMLYDLYAGDKKDKLKQVATVQHKKTEMIIQNFKSDNYKNGNLVYERTQQKFEIKTKNITTPSEKNSKLDGEKALKNIRKKCTAPHLVNTFLRRLDTGF